MDKKEINKLLKKGYVKDTLSIHIQEYDPHTVNDKTFPFRSLSYDMTDTFTDEQIAIINRFAREVNIRFPNIKISVTGCGYTKEEK